MSLMHLGRDPGESEMVRMLCGSIDSVARESIRPRQIDRDKHLPPELLRTLAEVGLFGISIPEAYGGAELSLQATASVIAALSRHDRAVATTVGLHGGLGTRGLVAFGTEAQKARYLPDLASGAQLCAFSVTEANAGSDLSAVQSSGRLDGGQIVINGAKVYVTNAHLAGLFTVLLSTPGMGGARRGQSLVLIEKTDRGLTIGAEEDKLGLRGSSTASLYFEDLRVPEDRVLFEPGRGKELIEHILGCGRLLMAAGCVGAAEAAIQLTRDQIANRRQFSRPLMAFEVVAEQFASMLAVHYGMESLVRRAARAQDTPEALLPQSLAAKVFASEGDWEIVDTALQLHGGMGFIEESTLPLLLRDARVTRIFEGANDVLLTRLGTLEAGVLTSNRQDVGFSPADSLHQHIRQTVQEARQSLGVRLFGRQRLLHTLGRLVTWREALDASALRAHESGLELDLHRLEQLGQVATAKTAALCQALPSDAPAQAIVRLTFEGVPS